MSRKHQPPQPPAPGSTPGQGDAPAEGPERVPGEGGSPADPAGVSADAAPVPPLPTAEECARLQARAAQADALEDRLKRAQADFVNESKRIARQAEQDRRFAIEQVAQDLVPLAEGLGSALAAAASVPAAESVREGLALVVRQLEDILGRHGIELMRPLGQPFDPAAHEAILMVERTDVPANHVADVIRPGFRLHGRVVRPAQVTVAKGAAKPDGAGPPGA
jgi:molecular chaperone GrpE